MTRFFIPSDQIKGNQVFLSGDDQHHLLHVMRQTIGAEFTVLNGKGQEYLAVIKEIRPDLVIGKIVTLNDRETEPQVKIRLVQSLPKIDKFELILQKNTELGVSSFQPVITERSTTKIEPGSLVKKYERWNRIMKEAAEQSGRKIIPRLEPVRRWTEVLATIGSGLCLIPWEGEREQSLKQILVNFSNIPESVTILIGSEGGFSQAEVWQAREVGVVPVTLGPRILRTETAGLAVTSAIFYHYGDLG